MLKGNLSEVLAEIASMDKKDQDQLLETITDLAGLFVVKCKDPVAAPSPQDPSDILKSVFQGFGNAQNAVDELVKMMSGNNLGIFTTPTPTPNVAVVTPEFYGELNIFDLYETDKPKPTSDQIDELAGMYLPEAEDEFNIPDPRDSVSSCDNCCNCVSCEADFNDEESAALVTYKSMQAAMLPNGETVDVSNFVSDMVSILHENDISLPHEVYVEIVKAMFVHFDVSTATTARGEDDIRVQVDTVDIY